MGKMDEVEAAADGSMRSDDAKALEEMPEKLFKNPGRTNWNAPAESASNQRASDESARSGGLAALVALLEILEATVQRCTQVHFSWITKCTLRSFGLFFFCSSSTEGVGAR